MTDLLERAEFFDQLQDILAEAMHGRGRVAFVSPGWTFDRHGDVQQSRALSKLSFIVSQFITR